MIIDLERLGTPKMFITEQVAYIDQHDRGFWTVRFTNSNRVFQYNRCRLLYFDRPQRINISEKGLYINKKRIKDVREVLMFANVSNRFFRITYSNGYTENLSGEKVYITRTPLNEQGGNRWDYLCKMAAETGLLVENDENILSKQYALVDLKRDNVPLSQFLGDKTTLRMHSRPQLLIYPFGCNESQQKAVERALTHQLSIIQGPPGTGKTQTILNIIANLLLQNKTILVVSNNNSAVDNVAEKLSREGLDFLVAKLGSVENKQSFVDNQTTNYPNITDWIAEQLSIVKKDVRNALSMVEEGFAGQKRLAELKAELAALNIEEQYSDDNNDESISKLDWLKSCTSRQLLNLLLTCQKMMDERQKPNLWFKLKLTFRFGRFAFAFFSQDLNKVVQTLTATYYNVKRNEIEQELSVVTQRLNEIDIKQQTAKLATTSMQVLKNWAAQKTMKGTRSVFTYKDIKPRTEEFLKEYPIILSTTYSAKSCISKDMVFDYVIMDEASQVDIKTGALALSCALNAVIVGDDKQLPNVVGKEERQAIEVINNHYKVDEVYNALSHSFLQSCNEIFQKAPSTLLREHYRCHPKIIDFCNQQFYDNELLAMTSDNNEEGVLKVIKTAKGNHARGHLNQREIDAIVNEVLPSYDQNCSIGIITPYREQAEAINKAIGKDMASTVHKYQGRECDIIILSMVDNIPTAFSDDPNLMNVAISRAKKALCVVTTGNEISQMSNLAKLIDYVQYNNFEVKQSNLHSVLDLLYSQYTAERLEFERHLPSVSNHLSENLVYNTLIESLNSLPSNTLAVVCHYPLHKLLPNLDLLTNEEKAYIQTMMTHVDFLVYCSLTKQPLLAIELDGWHFHRNSNAQQQRDLLKNQILDKYSLPLHRFSTTDVVNKKQ